jgi:hypothetical protein
LEVSRKLTVSGASPVAGFISKAVLGMDAIIGVILLTGLSTEGLFSDRVSCDLRTEVDELVKFETLLVDSNPDADNGDGSAGPGDAMAAKPDPCWPAGPARYDSGSVGVRAGASEGFEKPPDWFAAG